MNSLVTAEQIAASSPERITANVRRLIADGGVSAAEVSRALGVNRSAVSRRMNGEYEWRQSELTTIAVLLGVEGSALTE